MRKKYKIPEFSDILYVCALFNDQSNRHIYVSDNVEDCAIVGKTVIVAAYKLCHIEEVSCDVKGRIIKVARKP